MQLFLKQLKNKNVHLVGVTGSEGSNILRLLTKNHIRDITSHDFIDKSNLEKNYKLWHKGLSTLSRNELFHEFKRDLSKTIFQYGTNYLKNILQADLVFVPQSWRLYKENKLLWQAKEKNIPFYSITRIYLDYAPCHIIGVTGTVGKGSTAWLIVQLLQKAKRKVYFAGNESWRLQVADKLEGLAEEDYLVLEISHRQLQDGFSKAPNIAIFTNLYPNHLDEINWQSYKELKYSLFEKQKKEDLAILNYDYPEIRDLTSMIKSKIVFYSLKNKVMNTENIQNIYNEILSININQYPENILAAATVADILKITSKKIISGLNNSTSLPARIQLFKFSNIEFYNDIKSTTPWATATAINKLYPNIILIIGGDTKDINYQWFFTYLKNKVKKIIVLKSQLADLIIRKFSDLNYEVLSDLQQAISSAYEEAKQDDKILVSPAAAFFYRYFIKGKESLGKIITSLPPKERV